MRRLVVLVAVGALAAVAFLAFRLVAGHPDYSGDGSGEVVVIVPRGADGAKIADLLAAKDVVKSAEAFYAVAISDERSADIRPGAYKLREQMSAEAALDALLDADNRTEAAVTVIEGSRVSKVVKAIVDNTDFATKEIQAVLDNPKGLDLPPSAGGNPEGYLFPATYVAEPGMSVTEFIKQMVDKTKQVADELDIDRRAKALGLSYQQALTMASIVEREASGSDEDRRKVARVFYNRLDEGMPLQSDATVSYANNIEGEIWTTPEQRANPSAYNTYDHRGLPPGPIGSPGADAIEAALNPAKGPWLYFTLVNLDTGESAFAVSYADHRKNVEMLQQYCRTHEGC